MDVTKGDYKGLRLVFCLPGRSYSGPFLSAWTTLWGNCMMRGMKVKLAQVHQGNGTIARIWCLSPDRKKGPYQAPWNGEPYDFMHWIDSDQIFAFKHLDMLLRHNVDIVSGYYALANGKAYSMGTLDESNRQLTAWGEEQLSAAPKDEHGLAEVDWCGFGWTLIKQGVFEKMEYPWFATPTVNIAEISDVIGEDLYFCRNAKAHGFKTLVDPNCRIGHIKEMII